MYLVTHKPFDQRQQILGCLYTKSANSEQNLDLPVKYLRRLTPHMERANPVMWVPILFGALPECVVSHTHDISSWSIRKQRRPDQRPISMPMMNSTPTLTLLTKPNDFGVAAVWGLWGNLIFRQQQQCSPLFGRIRLLKVVTTSHLWWEPRSSARRQADIHVSQSFVRLGGPEVHENNNKSFKQLLDQPKNRNKFKVAPMMRPRESNFPAGWHYCPVEWDQGPESPKGFPKLFGDIQVVTTYRADDETQRINSTARLTLMSRIWDRNRDLRHTVVYQGCLERYKASLQPSRAGDEPEESVMQWRLTDIYVPRLEWDRGPEVHYQ